ncbi:MAG TPA: ABC transporter permease, partial [Actinomycetota bacterium]|nr:ABC transporter permease [Actinomycetota bacterium]
AQLGTLEQVAMSPFGLSKVVLAEVAAGLVFQFMMLAVLLVCMMAVTGKWLHMDLLSIIPIALMTVGGVVGLSMVMGGLAVVFKRVQSALQIMQMVFIALVAIPVSHFTWIKYMPLAWGNSLLRRVMVNGDSLLTIPVRDSLFLFAHMVAYLVVGTIVFRYFERIARARGLLGHY